jgi:pimeloyl-ACP methyl ester carboxylesterase
MAHASAVRATKIAVWLAAALILVVIGGAIYEHALRLQAVRRYPPAGRMVSLGDHHLQIDCRGAGTPTVVFESGLDTLGALSWSAVQGPVAAMTRACAYSRAGLLWSDPSPAPFDAASVAKDLHQALLLSGERPPFVMVGHSLGGPYILVYTRLYPEEVAGLVLVDPSHPDQVARFAAALGESEAPGFPLKIRLAGALAWMGVARLVSDLETIPSAPAASKSTADAYVGTSVQALVREEQSFAGTLAEAGQTRQLGQRPLIVLTAYRPDSAEDLKEIGWTRAQGQRFAAALKGLHDDEASWSTRGRNELVPDSSHYIQFERPDVVIAAVRKVIGDVRSQVGTSSRVE